MAAPTPSPSVYRTRAYRTRQRVLAGLAAVGLLLLGYLIGRWQDTPAQVSTLPAVGSAAPPETTPEPEPSSEAPEPTVYPTVQAESASARNGVDDEDTEDEGGGQNIGFVKNGDSLRFDNIDFGPVPATKVDVRVASDADDDDDDNGRMEIRLDDPEATAIGTLRVTRTGGWQKWRTDVVTFTAPVTGVHTVHLVFLRNDDDEFLNINWFRFGR